MEPLPGMDVLLNFAFLPTHGASREKLGTGLEKTVMVFRTVLCPAPGLTMSVTVKVPGFG